MISFDTEMAIMKLRSVSLLFALMQAKSVFAADDSKDNKKKTPDNNTSRLQVHVRNNNLNDLRIFVFRFRHTTERSSEQRNEFYIYKVVVITFHVAKEQLYPMLEDGSIYRDNFIFDSIFSRTGLEGRRGC